MRPLPPRPPTRTGGARLSQRPPACRGITKNLGTLSDKEAKLLAKGARLAGRAGEERLMRPLRQKIRREAPGQHFGTVTVTTAAHDGSDHARYSYEARIRFDPDSEVVDAKTVAFVQTMNLVKASGWWLRSQDPALGSPIGRTLRSRRSTGQARATSRAGSNDNKFIKSDAGGTQEAVIENGVVKQPAEMVDKPDGEDGDRIQALAALIEARSQPPCSGARSEPSR
jgi:hypothetical protein